jgi:uncharacterized protein involved in exopolysaccharide biosynthesis
MYQQTFQPEISPVEAEPQRGLDVLDALLIFARRKWLLFFFSLGGGLLVLIWSLMQTDLYKSDAVIMTPEDQQSGSAVMGQLSTLSALTGIGGGGKSPADIYVGLLKSRTVGEKMVRDFNLQQVYHARKVSDAQAILGSHTTIAADKDGLIDISVSEPDPKLATALANAYSQGLYALNSTLAIGQASQRRYFFDQQLALEKDHLTDAEIALKEVEEKTGLIQLTGQTSITISRVSQLQAQISNFDAQLAGLRASATDDNPEVVRIESEKAKLQEQLKAMLGRPGSDLPANLGIPSSRVPALSLEYIRKEREVLYHQTLFDLLARQLEAARIDEAKAAPIVQVVDSAEVPDRPYFPKVILFTILGVIAGFVFGCMRCVVLYVYDYVNEDPRLHMKMWAVKSALRGRVT